MADIPGDISIEKVDSDRLPENWATLNPREQLATKRIGDEWVERRKSAVLAVPSVIVGEMNYVLNPSHPDFGRISFAEPGAMTVDESKLFGRYFGSELGAGAVFALRAVFPVSRPQTMKC